MTRSRVSWVVASTNGTNITNVNPIQILPNVTSLGWGRIRLENIAIIISYFLNEKCHLSMNSMLVVSTKAMALLPANTRIRGKRGSSPTRNK